MGARLHVLEAGPLSGIPLVLLHGFGGHAASWAPVIETIPKDIRILAFDLPGHAGSLNYPGFGSPRVAALAVLAELEARSIPKAHVAGHSMGGAIAALMAMEKPEVIASLTLIAPGGFGPEMDQSALKTFAEATNPADLSKAYAAMMANGAVPDTAMISQLTTVRAAPGQREALMHVLAKISRGQGQGELPLVRLVEGIFPVTLLWGDEDRTVPFAQSANAPDWFSRVNLPGKGHMLIDEAPDAVAHAILANLQQPPQTI
jgi:pimeloyl-ACP methyl ester carboxylesterase